MNHPAAFYEPDGERFVASELTRGPWHPDFQHGGPPAALLADAIERFENSDGTFHLARITVELLQPIPIAAVRVEVKPGRMGRQAQRIEARLGLDDGTIVAVAHGLRIRRAQLELPTSKVQPNPPPKSLPETAEPFEFPFFQTEIAYHTAVDLRIVEGVWRQGPVAAWLRLRFPLVRGAATTALQRVMVIADAANGVCPALGPGFAFVNADLTVSLRRPLQGPWVGMRVRSIPESNGVGLCQAEIFDGAGEMGRCLQNLVVSTSRSAGRP